MDSRTKNYVDAVNNMIGNIPFQFTQRCMDCDLTIAAMASVEIDGGHVLGQFESNSQVIPFVIVGCEGYWHVNPHLVGMATDNWTPVEDVNDDI